MEAHQRVNIYNTPQAMRAAVFALFMGFSINLDWKIIIAIVMISYLSKL